VSTISRTLRAVTAVATRHAARVVAQRLTRLPMTRRDAVNLTNGHSAHGMPKLRTTWETPSARLGSMPIARTSRAGTGVIRRRAASGTRRCQKPSRITDPAYVPTDDDANPL